MKRIYLIFLCLFVHTIDGKTDQQDHKKPEPIKNLAHFFIPITTFGFGQGIFAKNSTLLIPTLYDITGKKTNTFLMLPALLYAPTNRFSIYAGLPIIASQKSSDCTRRGTSNLFIQLEYAFFQQKKETCINQATIVFNVAPPTTHLHSSCDLSSTTTAPSIGMGLFCGITTSHISPDWYLYLSSGIQINTGRHHSHLGNSILYQWGIGHYLGGFANVTCTGVLEFNGIYVQKSKVGGTTLMNSGGNTLFIGPALDLCSDRWAVLAGIQFPALQRLNGTQSKVYLQALVSGAYKF